MALGERLENLPPARPQRRKSARLVALHEPAVADHVGRKDGSEAAMIAIFEHAPPKCALRRHSSNLSGCEPWAACIPYDFRRPLRRAASVPKSEAPCRSV